MEDNIFKLIASKGVKVDSKHRYIYKNIVVSNSITSIISRNNDFSSIAMREAAYLGTSVHNIVEKIIEGHSNLNGYDENLITIAAELLGKIPSYVGDLTNGIPFICSWNKYLIGGTPDIVTDSHIIELKTCKKYSKSHEKQVLCYMEALGKEHGIIVYSDPKLPDVHIKRNGIKYKSFKKSVLQDLNHVFTPDIIIDDKVLLSDAELLSKVITQINELQEVSKELEKSKEYLKDRILNNGVISNILKSEKKAVLPWFTMSTVNSITKSIDYDAMKKDGVYEKYIKEKTNSYVKIIKSSNSKIMEGINE